jgi:hypothetical protein
MDISLTLMQRIAGSYEMAIHSCQSNTSERTELKEANYLKI